MDLLSNLYPTNQIGSDGFSWWLGQIESERKDDEKGSGRYRVRIVGLHPQTCDVVKSEDLPWALTMMPVTNPHLTGGHASVSDQLEPGCWVVGFFLDTDKQQPVIMELSVELLVLLMKNFLKILLLGNLDVNHLQHS